MPTVLGEMPQQAVVEVEALLFRGHPEVVDADLADYFGSIPHAELLKSVARRIVDRRVLHLIKMWLDSPVEETDERGRKTRTTEARTASAGIPQGSPLSPLLANLYTRRFLLGWKMLGLERSLGTRIVTYADDLVILCRKGKAEEALQRLREIIEKLKLTVNEEKTPESARCRRRVRLPGILVRADVLSEDRPGAPGIPAIEEKHQAHGGNHPRADSPTGMIDAQRQSTSKKLLAFNNQCDDHQHAATPPRHPDCREALIQIVALQLDQDARLVVAFCGRPAHLRAGIIAIPVHRVLHRENPQSEHAAGLCPQVVGQECPRRNAARSRSNYARPAHAP